MTTPKIFDYPLFALGFRAFFALAGLSALVLMLAWQTLREGHWGGGHYFNAPVWHAHEMLLGYSTAVIAGFLLTAVKNWTGRATLSGDPLAGLCLLWLYGRILPFYAGLLPDALIALADFAFLPILAWQVSKPILQARQPRHLVFVGLLLLMALGNGLIHADALGLAHTASQGITLALATLILTILIVAGKVFPFFTERGLPGTLIIRHPLFDGLAIATAALVFGLELFSVSGLALALAAGAAAISNLLRVAAWYVPRIWYVPLLWVLYVGYGWIIIGFALTTLTAFGLVLPSLALHAFTVGGIAALTLGMMARVSLGHTGRALRISYAIGIAFVLVNLTVLIRVLLPITLPDWYGLLVYVSSLSWLAAFALFVYGYLPILAKVRADGQQG